VKGLAQSIIKMGPIPKHVAFIMDGNRRWARLNRYDTIFGHSQGFNKLQDALEWCLELGVEVVTVYAFSIENFKRTKKEVEDLLNLTRDKFALFLREEEIIEKYGVCVRVLGDLELLPPDVREAMARVMEKSKNHKRSILNVCFSYTARHEMCDAIRSLAKGVENQQLYYWDICEELFERCLYTGYNDLCKEIDLLIRTSGERRLSDFMLWQSSFSCLVFLKVLWPDFSSIHFYFAILLYQKNYPVIQERKEMYRRERDRIQAEIDEKFLHSLDGNKEETSLQLSNFVCQRNERIQQFLRQKDMDFAQYIHELINVEHETTKD